MAAMAAFDSLASRNDADVLGSECYLQVPSPRVFNMPPHHLALCITDICIGFTMMDICGRLCTIAWTISMQGLATR